jgi:hypothetical protein
MRGMRGFVRIVSGCWASLLVSRLAFAQLWVAEPPDSSPIAHAELAYAFGAGKPVTWLSLRAEHGPVAVVVALEAEAAVEEGLDAWFGALEQAGSPRVLPANHVSAACGRQLTPLFVSWPRAASALPSAVELQTPDDVRALLDSEGLLAPSELPLAARYWVWSWPDGDSAFTTRTLRIQGQEEPLALEPHGSFPILLSALTRGAMTHAAELMNSELAVTYWVAQSQSNDYRQQALGWLGAHDDPLLELRQRGSVLDWSSYEGVPIPPLVESYAQAAGLEEPERATDAELALAAVDSDVATLQRVLVSSRFGASWRAFTAGGEPWAPVVRARRLDTSSCVSSQAAPSPVERAPVSGGKTSPTPVSRDDFESDFESRPLGHHEPTEINCSGSTEHRQDETDCSGASESSSTQDDEVDCSSEPASTSQSDDADCSGGSEESSETESTDCSGGSEESNQTEDTDCSGGSEESSQSDAEATDCSSDSSSSSDTADDGCSGNSSGEGSDSEDDSYSGYEGETCTGQAAPRKAPTAQHRSRLKRPRRLKASFWTVALAALVLPIRRRKRGLASCRLKDVR